jgi:hypothetical protein
MGRVITRNGRDGEMDVAIESLAISLFFTDQLVTLGFPFLRLHLHSTLGFWTVTREHSQRLETEGAKKILFKPYFERGKKYLTFLY